MEQTKWEQICNILTYNGFRSTAFKLISACFDMNSNDRRLQKFWSLLYDRSLIYLYDPFDVNKRNELIKEQDFLKRVRNNL